MGKHSLNSVIANLQNLVHTFGNKHGPFHRIQQQNSQMPVFLPKAACSSPVRTTKKDKMESKNSDI